MRNGVRSFGLGLSQSFTPGIPRAQAEGARIDVQAYVDGPVGAGQSVDAIAQKIREGQNDPDVQGIAAEAVRKAGFDGRGKKPSVRQICQACLDEYRSLVLYASDPGKTEQVQSPSATMCLRGKAGLCLRRGDCDDATAALGAMILSLAIPVMICVQPFPEQAHVLLVAFDENGTKLGVDGANNTYSVGPLGSAGAPPNVPGQSFYDPLKAAPVGPVGVSGAQLITMGASQQRHASDGSVFASGGGVFAGGAAPEGTPISVSNRPAPGDDTGTSNRPAPDVPGGITVGRPAPGATIYRGGLWLRSGAHGIEYNTGLGWLPSGIGQGAPDQAAVDGLKASLTTQWQTTVSTAQGCATLAASDAAGLQSAYADWQAFSSQQLGPSDYSRLKDYARARQLWDLKVNLACSLPAGVGATGVGEVHIPGINCNIDVLVGQKTRLLVGWDQLTDDVDNCPLCKEDKSVCAATPAFPNGAPDGFTLTQKYDYIADHVAFMNWYNADMPLCDADAEIQRGYDFERIYKKWRALVDAHCKATGGNQAPDLPPLRNDDQRNPDYVPPPTTADTVSSIVKGVAVVAVSAAAIYGLSIIAPGLRNAVEGITSKRKPASKK